MSTQKIVHQGLNFTFEDGFLVQEDAAGALGSPG